MTKWKFGHNSVLTVVFLYIINTLLFISVTAISVQQPFQKWMQPSKISQQFTSKKPNTQNKKIKNFKKNKKKSKKTTKNSVSNHKKYNIMLMCSNRWKPISKTNNKQKTKKHRGSTLIFQNTGELPLTSLTILHIPKNVEMTDLYYCGLWIPASTWINRRNWRSRDN